MEKWQSRTAFLLAAIGSAVGLGNIWRFPYVCYRNGGGAFLIPYFVALFTVGIPLLIAEFSVGTLFRTSAPSALRRISKKAEWVGWWSVFVAFFISIYYCTIMAWCLCYLFHSIGLVWQPDASNFFFNIFLNQTSSPGILGNMNVQILLALLVIWTSIYLILYRGTKSIGKVVAITVPLPTILLIILMLRGLTLPGAMEGLEFYLRPDFSKLTAPSVWLAAYAQIFFSIGVAQGIMIAYSSFLKKKSDITNNAFITSLADGGTAFLAGFAVFSVLGYLAYQTGLPMEEIARGGIGLAFITYPTAIAEMPFAASFFGVIFFMALLTFGIDSAFSMVESITNGIKDKFGISRKKANFIVCSAGFLLGLVLVTGGGIYWVDIMDHFMANIALVIVGLLECLTFAYVLGGEKIRRYANEVSEIHIGRWFSIMLKLFAPVVLVGIAVASVVELMTEGYEDFPAWSIVAGMLIVGASVIASIVMARLPCRQEQS
ncbi:MAG: sodium-dependent transporter [Thermoplasmata archaeon]|nr:MAG: sodium-dependent transporter [Thermoplasmata archaeon]HDN50262.1 sodium-dependent transporter [Thermoplasmatales archaeon]